MTTTPTAKPAHLIASLGLAILASCAPRTPVVDPPVAPPESFSAAGAVPAPARWWTAFDDPTLDRLVERALEGNLDLATAWHRMREAQAIVEREASDLHPDVDGLLGVVEERPERGGGEDPERLRSASPRATRSTCGVASARAPWPSDSAPRPASPTIGPPR